MKKLNKVFTLFFLIVELGIYISFLIMDFANLGDSTLLKFFGIAFIVFCAFIFLLINKTINKYILFALIFTLIADVFLLLINDYYPIGLLCFICVQTLYYFSLKPYLEKNFIPQLIIRGFIFITFSILSISTSNYEIFLSSCYIIFFILNIITIIFIRNKGSLKLFLLGLVLFIMCDLFVGLYNLGNYLSIPNQINKILLFLSEDLMWFFYLPSQVIICLYAKEKALKK